MPKTNKVSEKKEYVQDTFLAAYYSVSRATIWRWVKQGRIPEPVKFSPGTTRWHFPSVVNQLEKKAA